MRRYRLLFNYLLFEMTPTLVMGVFTFIFILLMFQVLRLTEFVLVHDVSIRTIIHLMSYMSISFLPAILPMSLIFAIVLAYNRLTSDSEIIAMKSLGISMWALIVPALGLGIVIAILSAYMAFQVGPWGNRQFELLVNDIGNSKLVTAVKEGTFSESFFDLVIYTNAIDPDTEELQQVFIYDERDSKNPTTIIADRGQIISEKSFDSYHAFVRLINGDIHKNNDDGHTKIHFETYDLNITNPIDKKTRDKSLQSLNYSELRDLTKDPNEKSYRMYNKELHRRMALSAACLLFVILGIGLGCRTHHRSGKSGGSVLSVAVIVVYWVLYIVGDSIAKNPALPIWLCSWLPVLVMTPFALFFIRRNWS